MTVKIEKNLPGSVGGKLTLTVKNMATGLERDVVYTITGSGVGTPGNYETVVAEELTKESSAKSFV